MGTPDGLNIYIAPDTFRIEPLFPDGKRSHIWAEIDRVSGASRPVEGAVLPGCTVLNVHGLIGVKHLLAGPYLVVIAEREHVGYIMGRSVWRCTKVEIVPYNPAALHHLNEIYHDDEQIYIRMIQSVLQEDGLYFSYSYDLTNNTQRYGMLSPEIRASALSIQANKRFMWNWPLCYEFAQIPAVQEFVLPLIYGFVSIQPGVMLGYNKFDYAILSRRAFSRAGTRYNVRGIDNDGNVANFVEVEQLVLYNGAVASFVQTRGSIPLFWEECINIRYKPVLAILPVDHMPAFSKHMDHLIANYGQQVLINLIDQKGRELLLGNLFKELVTRFGGQYIRYIAFDFHKECSGMRFERLNVLLDDVNADIVRHGYYLRNAYGQEVRKQTGTTRTNCMDCLDRTNVVQSMVARRVLAMQLVDLGIVPMADNIEQYEQLDFLLRNVWADHADAISKQYAGTGALKTDVTRTGKRTLQGIINDGVNSLMRYWKNNFQDGFRQDAIDLFVGVYRPVLQAPSPFPPPSEFLQRLRLLPWAMLVWYCLAILSYVLGSVLFALVFAALFAATAYVIIHFGPELVDMPKFGRRYTSTRTMSLHTVERQRSRSIVESLVMVDEPKKLS